MPSITTNNNNSKKDKDKEKEKEKITYLVPIARQYKNFFFTQNAFSQSTIPRPVVEGLIHSLTLEIKARGVLTPFVLLPFRPDSDAKDVREFISQVFPKHKPPLEGDDLLRLVRVADPHCLATVLKWCWARLPGGIVSWKVYNQFKKEEEKEGHPMDAFVKIIPRCVESATHGNILFDFFDLLASIVTHGRHNGLIGRKVPRLAGTWAFDIKKPGAKESSSFADGLAAWSLAAEATNHLFFAFLRSLSVNPKNPLTSSAPPLLPRPLENILLGETNYPPDPIFKSKLVAVPMVTLTVGKLSANPMVLLKRVAKTIRFDNSNVFATEDDFNTLYFLFNEPESIEYKINDESLRIINEVINENPLVTDHPIMIKETPKLAYDVRGKTWSKFYNHAYIDPCSGDLRRPLTNYVYDDQQLKLIKKVSVPSQEVKALPYPDSPNLKGHGVTSRPSVRRPVISAISDEDWEHFVKNDLLEKRSSRVSADGLVTAGVSQIAIADFFIWVWMCSLSQEQTEVRKATFGRSVVVELVISPGERRWVIVEEILHPEPGPIKPKSEVKDRPLPKVIPRRVVSSPVQVKRKPAPPPSPQIQQQPPDPPEDQHHYHHYYHHVKKPRDMLMNPAEYLDPLVEALAKRLEKNNLIAESNKEVEMEMKRDKDKSKGKRTSKIYIDKEIQTDVKDIPSITIRQPTESIPSTTTSTPSPPNGMKNFSIQTEPESAIADSIARRQSNRSHRSHTDDKSVYYTPKLIANEFDDPIPSSINLLEERQELENQKREQKQLQLQLEQMQKQLQLQQLQLQQFVPSMVPVEESALTATPSLPTVIPSNIITSTNTPVTNSKLTTSNPPASAVLPSRTLHFSPPHRSASLQLPPFNKSLSTSQTSSDTPTLSAIQTSWLADENDNNKQQNLDRFQQNTMEIDKPLPNLPPDLPPSPPIEDLNKNQPLPPQTDDFQPKSRQTSVKRKPVGDKIDQQPTQQQLVESINDLVGIEPKENQQIIRRQRSRTLDDSSSGDSIGGGYYRNSYGAPQYYEDYDRFGDRGYQDRDVSGRLMSPFPVGRNRYRGRGGAPPGPGPGHGHGHGGGGGPPNPVAGGGPGPGGSIQPAGPVHDYYRYNQDLDSHRPHYDERPGSYELPPPSRFRNLRDSYSSSGYRTSDNYVLDRPYSPAPSSSASQPPHPVRHPHQPGGGPSHPGDIRSLKKKSDLRNNLDSFESPFFGRELSNPSNPPGPPFPIKSSYQQERDRGRGFGRPSDRGFRQQSSHPYAEMVESGGVGGHVGLGVGAASGPPPLSGPSNPLRPIHQHPPHERSFNSSEDSSRQSSVPPALPAIPAELPSGPLPPPPPPPPPPASEKPIERQLQSQPQPQPQLPQLPALEPPKLGLLEFEHENDKITPPSSKLAPVPAPGPTPGHTPGKHSDNSSFLQTSGLANTGDSGLGGLSGIIDDSNSELTDSNASHASSIAKWAEVKENLNEMRQSFGKNTIIPPMISHEFSSDKGKSGQSLISGVAAPLDYYDAMISTVRKPSIHTGDHVKGISVKLDEDDSSQLSSYNNSPRSAPIPSTGQDNPTYNMNKSTFEGQFLKDRSASGDISPTRDNNLYKSLQGPSSTSSLPGRSRPASSSYSTSDNNNNKRGSLPANFDPLNEQSVLRAQRVGLLDTSKMSSTEDLKPSSPKRDSEEKVSRYSILGIINATKRRSQQSQTST